VNTNPVTGTCTIVVVPGPRRRRPGLSQAPFEVSRNTTSTSSSSLQGSSIVTDQIHNLQNASRPGTRSASGVASIPKLGRPRQSREAELSPLRLQKIKVQVVPQADSGLKLNHGSPSYCTKRSARNLPPAAHQLQRFLMIIIVT
jgi:hypothetical protein